MSKCEFGDRFGSRPPARIEDVRLLLAAMLRDAVRDSVGGDNIPVEHEVSGAEFVRSELYVGYCDFFGIRPSARQEMVERLPKV